MMGAAFLLSAKLTAAVAWFAAAVFSVVDPVWATPINTLLLLITLIAGALLSKKVGRVEEKADRNHETSTHAANAAASAAESAATAARITQELGGSLRGIQAPSTPTEPGGDSA